MLSIEYASKFQVLKALANDTLDSPRVTRSSLWWVKGPAASPFTKMLSPNSHPHSAASCMAI